jgi:hypothetical protein
MALAAHIGPRPPLNEVPPQSSAEVYKSGAIPALPHTPSWRGASLIKHRDLTFTFYLQENTTLYYPVAIFSQGNHTSRNFGWKHKVTE